MLNKCTCKEPKPTQPLQGYRGISQNPMQEMQPSSKGQKLGWGGTCRVCLLLSLSLFLSLSPHACISFIIALLSSWLSFSYCLTHYCSLYVTLACHGTQSGPNSKQHFSSKAQLLSSTSVSLSTYLWEATKHFYSSLLNSYYTYLWTTL